MKEYYKYKKILDNYIKTYNLKYLLDVDDGIRIHRQCMNNIDIDLRMVCNKMHLQFWSTIFCYVFEWTNSRDVFFQAIEKTNYYTNVEVTIYNLMDIIINNHRYIATKYGLK